MGGSYMFVIVGDGDIPLYEAEFPSSPTHRVRQPRRARRAFS